MSIDATRWAWEQKVTPTQKLVLLSLADRSDENSICYPSTKRLELDTGLYRETIFDAIKVMEAMGVIEVQRSVGKGNKYRLVGVRNRHENQSEKADRYEKADQSEKPDTTSRKKPTTQSVKADYYQSVKADTESTNITINESTKKRPRKKLPGINLSEFLADCKKNGVKPIAGDDPIFDFAEQAKIPLEFLRYGWVAFRDEFLEKPNKTQADWRATFRTYVRNGYLNVWKFNREKECYLTDKGIQYQNALSRETT